MYCTIAFHCIALVQTLHCSSLHCTAWHWCKHFTALQWCKHKKLRTSPRMRPMAGLLSQTRTFITVMMTSMISTYDDLMMMIFIVAMMISIMGLNVPCSSSSLEISPTTLIKRSTQFYQSCSYWNYASRPFGMLL